MKARILTKAFVVVIFVFAPGAKADRIVVANDDWTLSDVGFSWPNDPGTFALNVADWFTGGQPGNFLVYSNHFGLTDLMITSVMTSAGHTWTVNTSVSFNVPTLLTYDAVFTGGFELGEVGPDNQVLTDYVNAGGNVYVCSAGNPWDPDLWNMFLGSFGLEFGDQLAYVGDIPISSTHVIFNGVDSLYTQNGSYINDLAPLDPRNQILVNFAEGGAYAIYDGVIPVPGAVLLGMLGLSVAGMKLRKFA